MIANLQLLRAVAAWAVVAHHLRGPLGEIWPPLGDTLAFAFGVDLFFVISGYVMVASTAGRGIGPLAFWRRRAARIAPLYWLVTLALAAALAAGLRPVGVAEWRLSDLLASLAFVAHQRADGYPGPLLGVGWTLVYEAAFYAIFGAALAARRLAAPGLVAIAAVAALVAAGAALRPEGFAARTYLAPIMGEFAVGAALALWPPSLGPRAAWAALALGLGGALAGAAALAAIAPGGDLITPGGAGAAARALLFGAPAALIVAAALALERAGRACRAAALLDQGAASYAVYLIHLPLLQIVGKVTGGGPLLALVGAPAVALAGLWLHRRVEAPMTAFLNAPRARRAAAVRG